MSGALAAQSAADVGERGRGDVSGRVARHRRCAAQTRAWGRLSATRFRCLCVGGIHLGSGQAHRVTQHGTGTDHTQADRADAGAYSRCGPTSAEPLAMLEPLTMRCIVSGSTFTSASMTIEQPIKMQSEASVTSVKELDHD